MVHGDLRRGAAAEAAYLHYLLRPSRPRTRGWRRPAPLSNSTLSTRLGPVSCVPRRARRRPVRLLVAVSTPERGLTRYRSYTVKDRRIRDGASATSQAISTRHPQTVNGKTVLCSRLSTHAVHAAQPRAGRRQSRTIRLALWEGTPGRECSHRSPIAQAEFEHPLCEARREGARGRDGGYGLHHGVPVRRVACVRPGTRLRRVLSGRVERAEPSGESVAKGTRR